MELNTYVRNTVFQQDEDEVTRQQQAQEDQEVDFFTPRILGLVGGTMFGDSLAVSNVQDGRKGVDYWTRTFPDEDDDPYFWPHDDLEAQDV